MNRFTLAGTVAVAVAVTILGCIQRVNRSSPSGPLVAQYGDGGIGQPMPQPGTPIAPLPTPAPTPAPPPTTPSPLPTNPTPTPSPPPPPGTPGTP